MTLAETVFQIGVMEILTLFLSAIAIGVFAIVFGGTLFLSLPLFQILFPELAIATIIGTVKFGSVIRNAKAVYDDRTNVERSTLILLIPLGLGSIAGAVFLTEMTMVAVPIILVTGLLLSEFANRFTPTPKFLFPTAVLIGVYGGIFGAGIMLLLLALLQLRFNNSANARLNALTLEMCVSLIAVAVYAYAGNIDWAIAIVWATGGYFGGMLGGRLNQRIRKLSKPQQQWVVRTSFVLALSVAVWKL